MSEFKRQGETCVTQIPECTPLAPALADSPKDISAPIIKNLKEGARYVLRKMHIDLECKYYLTIKNDTHMFYNIFGFSEKFEYRIPISVCENDRILSSTIRMLLFK